LPDRSPNWLGPFEVRSSSLKENIEAWAIR
jgi:hypothetical protein